MCKRGNATLPSSAEEGWPKAGVVVAKRIPMISTFGAGVKSEQESRSKQAMR